MLKTDLILLHAPSVYDFRRRATLWGPISDAVPSTHIFDMYPIGFPILSEYLERYGFRTDIVNLAVHMLRSKSFDAERFIARLDACAFGIDLHWLAHAQGALEVARIVRQHHSGTPIIFGGFSASYFHDELIRYPQVDYVIRGDSAEEPLRQLLACLREGRAPVDVPNLTWKDGAGEVQVNAQTYVPTDLGHIRPGFRHMVRSVMRTRDLVSYAPFAHWLKYPIMAALTVRGCSENCTICGGCSEGHRKMSGRKRPAFRNPEQLAQDVREARSISRGPIIILGDIRLAGMDYARRFLRAVQGVRGPFMVEFFWPVSRDYARELTGALEDLTVEFSPDSHDPVVRKASNKQYTSEEIVETACNCLEAGVRRFDMFFMIGLPKQTAASVLATVDFCQHLIEAVDGDTRLIPFITPLAPFLDPGSAAFENPDKSGYRLHCHTLEDHRQALLGPTWKHVLSYETKWMDRDTLAATSYEAGRRLNQLKARYGITSQELARETEDRISQAIALMARIDALVETCSPEDVQREMLAFKDQIDGANMSSGSGKGELDMPVGWLPFNVWGLVRTGVSVVWNALRRQKGLARLL